MAIGSRDYARPFASGSGLPQAVKMLLIANLAVFLLFFFGGGSLSGILSLLLLVPADTLGSLRIWQPATFMFISAGVLNFLWNMLALWMFGRELEEAWGTERFLRLYFMSGIGAGLVVMLAEYTPFGNPHVPTAGLSAPVYGILAASAILWPDRDLIYFFFPMKMKWFVLLVAAVDFLFAYTAGIGQIAVLSGLLFGWLFVKSGQARRVGRRVSLSASLKDSYKAWKLRRAKRKFQVYLRKHGSDRDRFVN